MGGDNNNWSIKIKDTSSNATLILLESGKRTPDLQFKEKDGSGATVRLVELGPEMGVGSWEKIAVEVLTDSVRLVHPSLATDTTVETNRNWADCNIGVQLEYVSNGHQSAENAEMYIAVDDVEVCAKYSASAPPMGVTPNPDTVCNDSSTLQLSGGSLGDGASWQWYTDSCGGTAIGTGDSIKVSPDTSTIYFVRAEGDCNITTCASDTIHMAPPPQANFTADTACIGDSTQFTDQSTGNIQSWNWWFGDGTTSNIRNPSHLYDSSKTYSAQLIVENQKGCKDTITNNVIVEGQPQAPPKPAGDQLPCAGEQQVAYQTDTVGLATEYQWSLSSGGSISSGQGSTQIQVDFNTAQTGLVCVRARNRCGQSDSSCLSIDIQELPKVDAGQDSTIKEGDSLRLGGVPTVTDGTSSYSFRWEPPTGLSKNTIARPFSSPAESTTYQLTVTDSNGCTSSDTVLIKIEERGQLYIPNAFSPNNDGHNDIWKIQGSVTDFHLIIFDRWGHTIYESDDINNGWNGKHNGKKANSGVYIYYLEITLPSGNTKTKKGSIHLIR